MSSLASHQKLLHTIVPDMSYIAKYTDRRSYPGDHWFWVDTRVAHRFNPRGQAVLSWKVKPCVESGWKRHGDFTVARLWIESRGPIPPRARIDNLCGLSQCINPDHWHVPNAAPPYRIGIHAADIWYLIDQQTQQRVEREVVVYVSDGQQTHALVVVPFDRRPLGPPRSMCGVTLPVESLAVTRTNPTCGRCV